MKILMVLTSHDKMGDSDEKTGFWLEEFAAPYYVFKDAGADITLASPKGGKPPVDPRSTGENSQTEFTKRYNNDEEAQNHLAHTKLLSDIRADDYDALFYPGGHGPLWDLVSDAHSIKLIENFWAQDKIVSAVCHAPIVLINAKDEKGAYIVKGKDVAGFTNDEEDAIGLTDKVPLLVENELKSRGGNYSKVDNFEPYVQVDGNLITGQNPPSSEPVAKAVLNTLK